MTDTSKLYTIRQYPPSQILDNGTYSDNNLTYTNSITDGIDISGTQYGGGSYIVKYSSYKENNNNLIARYKFDNNATNMLLDSTGNGYDLSNNGATFDNTNYKVGDGSIYLNGNSQYISIPSTINPYTIWNNNGITFSLWSKLSTSSGLSASLLSFGDSVNKTNIIEPIVKGIKQYPETPSTNADSWTDNGYNVVCKTSDAILSPQISCYLFNNSIVSPDHYHSSLLFSGTSPYNYTGSTSFKGTNGLVIYIDLGRSITLRSMRIAPRDNAAYPTLNFLGAMPGTFKIYASNDSACWTSNTHASWTEIHSQTTSLTYNYNQFTNFGIFSTNTTAYRYFAMVVYNLIGNYTYLTFSEWDIFGIYDITPISNILLDRVTKNTGMSGWVQIKHLPGGPELANNTGNGRTWFSGNTFNGSTVNNYTIGNPSNNSAEWSIPFDSANVQFYLFYENTNDFNSEWYDRWGVMRKSDMVEVNYPNWKPFYKALNYPNGKTEGLQYNRINNIENADPNFFGTVPHLKKDGTVNDIGPYIKGPYSIYIENSATGWWGAPPTEVNVFVKYTTDAPSDGSNYKYLSFTHSGDTETQTTYTVNFPENTDCDILLVAGGGGGGQQNAGGGGAGGLVLIQNFQANGSYTINVGKGGNGGGIQLRGDNGYNSTFIKSDNSVIITANGGGGGGGCYSDATNGGSGGGGRWAYANGTQTQKSQSQIGVVFPASLNQFGEDGGHGGGGGASYPGGGGGGAGGVGGTSGSDTTGQNGGLGINKVGTFIFSEKFSSSIGDNGWFAGGGGSGGDGASDGYGNGGSTLFGGGGNGDGIGRGLNAINGTGGGGGGTRDPSTILGGNGGSGIVLIRYKNSIPTNTNTNININNLVAYYKFNDSGSLGLDNNPSSTKYNLTPTIVGGTGGYNTTTAIEGASFQATNDGDYLEGSFPIKTIYDNSTTGISVSCWFYKKSGITYDNIYNTLLFAFYTNPNDKEFAVSLGHYGGTHTINWATTYLTYGNESYCSGFGPNQTLDTWYHLVISLNKSGIFKAYLNGTDLNLVAGAGAGQIKTSGSSVYPVPQFANVSKLRIFNPSSTSSKFNGNIDEFYVFNKELTQAEVTSLYNKTITSNSLNIIEPNITSGGTIIPVSAGIDYKYLEFSSTPDLIHNFTDFNTEATWKAKANSIPGFTYSFAVYFADGYAGLWSPENNVGYIEYQLPSSYNNLTVNFGNIYYQSEVRLLINGVVKKTATGNQGSLIHTQSYNVGDILRIEELYAIMNADLIITLTKTIPNLIYDFSSYNSEATWKAYATTIPNFTYSLNTFLTPFDNDAVWTGDRVVGWIQMTLPSTHNFLSITYGLGVQGVEEVRLLINGVEKSRATSTNRLVTYSQAYNVGDVVRIEETFSTMSANIIITLTSTNQTSYTVNFPENTQCSALIIGNPNYTYLQNLSLYGTYNIVVGNTSSITKNDNSITYNNSVTAQTVPFTNTITDSTITYNLVPKVIIRYKLTKTITSNSQDEITSDNWIAINKNSTNNDIKFEIQNSTGTGSSYTLTGYSYNNGLVTGTNEDGASTTYVNLLNLGIQLGSVLTNWSFNTKITGKSITPLILEDTGSSNYVIRGIGTSRYVTTTGVNSYPFGLVQGTNVFSTSNYKFGWKDGTTTSTNSGVISFNGNNVVAQTTYALTSNSSTNITLNTAYAFGNQALGNRTYSFKLDFNSTMSIIDNTWHHIVWSISSTGVWSIYIDNQYINPNITRLLFNITYARQYIGKSLFSSNGWLIGNIDDLRIYNKVLTTNEIASIYNNLSNVYPWLIFKNDPAYWSKIDISSSQPNWAGNYQLAVPYSYLDNSYLVNNFTGDFITIKLPYKIYLTKYVICSTINKINKAPQHFSIYGSIDGVNWNKIVEKHLTPTSYINTQIPNSTNSTGYYTDDETKSTVAYDYYGIVVNKLIGPLDTSDNNLSFSLWNIYGSNDLKDRSYFEFGLVTDTSKTIGSSLKDGLIKANNSNIFIKSGNTNTPVLTIGTNNKVAVGKNIASEAFDVSGSLIANEYRIKNQNYPIIDASSNIVASGNTDISGNLTLNNNKFVVNATSGNLSVAGTLDISKNININNGKTIIDLSGNIKSQGNFDLSSNININNYVLVDASGSVIMNNTLDISNNATLRSNLDIKGNIKSSAFTTNSSLNKVSIRNTSVDPSYNFHVSGSTRLEGNLDVDGNIIIVDTVQQTSEQFIINNDGNTVALTVKQIGAQPIVDLRDDGKSVFYLADNGLLGLGTTTPSCTVDVSGSCYVQQTLDVSGNLNIGGNTYLSENILFNDILDVSQNVNINNKFFVDPSGNVDICGNMLIYGYLISNGNNANSGGFQQDGNAIINGELRVLYNIDISQNLRVLDTFIVDASGNIKSKGQFDLSNNLRNGSNYSINTVGNVYSAGNIDISKNFNINNGVFSADVSGNIIVNGFIDISKNLYVNGNKFTIDQSGNITAMGNFDISNNLTINTDKFIVDTSGNIKSVGNFDISNNFNINNGAFKIDNNGNISSQNNFDISGNMSINGQKLTVSNTGNIKSAGTLDISNNFSINIDKFTVDSSGNTIAKGNVDISNNLTIGNNTFNVDTSGNIQSSGTLDVSQNLKIGSTLLTVDHQNKRVGINTTTPEYSLDVSGQIVTNKAIMGSSYTVGTNTTSSSLNIAEPVVISETIERIYPPIRNATSNTTTITDQTYGNGVYIVSASSNHPGEEPFKIINTNNTGWTQSWTSYGGTPAGTYTGTFSLGGYSGECVKIQLPYKIKLTRYIIEASSIGGVNRAPSIYKIFGSNDDTNWVEIHHKSVALISSNYVSNKYEETISNTNYYKHYALVVNKNIGIDTWLSIGEWQIYGREKITPESIDANYKYLAFTYQAPPNVVLREYPPSAMTINSTTLSVGGTDSAGNTYGAGTYTINYPYGWSDIDVYTLFNKSIGYNWIGSLGSSFNGNYIGAFCNDTRTSLGTYFGSCKGTLNDRVWTYLSSSASGISIDLTQDTNSNKYYGSTFTYSLPSPIYLQNLQLYNRNAYSTFAAQAPKSFRVYGMNIGDNGWTQIANYSNLNAWTSYTSTSSISDIIWDGTSGAESLTFKINANTSYSMYGFVVNALLGSNENFTLAEIKLFGTDYYVSPSGQTQYTVNFLENTECDILVVGGGGGGGASVGSGGGAGGLIYYSNVSIAIGTYTIIVGGGGTGAVNYLARGANGYNSSAFGNTSYGGGGGSGQSWVYNTSGTASGTLQTTSANQGSGAGGTRYKTIGNGGTVGQGNSGGNEVEGGNIFAAGGGGGAGGVGGNGSLITLAGVGGIGVSSTITGTSIDYAGGGGGQADNLVNGSWVRYGGIATHGGGAGGEYGANGTSGKGGGGGGGHTSGGNGGSGIVIVRYKFTKTINNDSIQIIYSNNATFGYRDISTSFIPSIVQLNTGQTFINSLSQYINFNFGNDNKCKMDASGNLTLNGDIFIYSDGRIKENVTTITSALDKVNELSGITYNIINNPRRQIGVVAQEVEKVLPEVIKEEDGVKTVAYSNMIGLLIEALKELNDRVDQTE